MEDEFYEWAKIIINQLDFWWVILITNLPYLVLATIVAIAFYVHAKFVKRIIYKSLHGLLGIRVINNLFANVSYSIIMIFGLFTILNILNLNQALTSLFIGAALLGLILGFAFQDLSVNFISSAIKRLFSLRDAIDSSAIIRTFQGLRKTTHQKDISQKPSANISKGEQRRIEIEFSMSPKHDLKKVKVLCGQAIGSIVYIVKDKKIEVFYTGCGDNVIKVVICFWIYNNKLPGFTAARHQTIMNLIHLLEQNNFTIITPIFLKEQKNEAENFAENNNRKSSTG